MKTIASTIFLGYTFLASVTPDPNADEPVCRTLKKDGLLHANCRKMILQTIPQNQLDQIESLDLSHSTIRELDHNSFVTYKQLRILTMERTIIEIHDGEFLKPLKKLQVLSLAEAKIPNIETLELPSEVVTLNLSSLGLTSFHFKTILPNLRSLILDHNRITRFPSLIIKNTLKHVNLDDNIDITILVEDIVPYCQLRHLEVNSLHGTNANTKKEYCHCERLTDWLTKQNIFSNMDECELNNVRPGLLCDLNINPSLMDQFNACISNESDHSNTQEIKYAAKSKWPLYLGGIFLLIAFSGATIGAAYAFCFKRRSPIRPHSFKNVYAENSIKESELDIEGVQLKGDTEASAVETENAAVEIETEIITGVDPGNEIQGDTGGGENEVEDEIVLEVENDNEGSLGQESENEVIIETIENNANGVDGDVEISQLQNEEHQ